MGMRRMMVAIALASMGCLGQPFTVDYFARTDGGPETGVPADPAKDSGGAEPSADGEDEANDTRDADAGEVSCYTPSVGQNPYACDGTVPAPEMLPLVFERITAGGGACGDVSTPLQCQCVETYNCECLRAASVCGDAGIQSCFSNNGPEYLLAVVCD